jgi:hypothetical protein
LPAGRRVAHMVASSPSSAARTSGAQPGATATPRAVVAAVVVLGLAGCHGGGLTRTALVAKVSRICALAKRATNNMNDPRFADPQSVARYLTLVAAIANRRLEQFKLLRPSGDVSFEASDASDWGSFVGQATAATQAMTTIAKRSRREAPSRAAGRATYDLFYAVDDEIGAAADNVTNAPQGIPACYS